jgi:hypothetical protein
MSDIWSVGVCMYELLDLESNNDGNYSGELKELICGMLEKVFFIFSEII